MAWQGSAPPPNYYQDPNYGPPPAQPGFNAGYAPPPGNYPPPHDGGFSPPGAYPPPGSYPPPGGYHPSQQGFAPPPMQPEFGTGYIDPENPAGDEAKGFGFSDESIRKGFIKKVYGILSVQLALSGGIIALFLLHKPTNVWVLHNPALWVVAIILLLGSLLPMVCCENVRRQSPMNFIFLGVFTLAQSFFLGITAGTYKSEEVLLAVVVTAAVCIGLTIFAFQTRWDFTVLGGVLFVALIILVVFGFVSIFFPGRTLKLIYASFGALLFSVYLIYDTQLMMGGSHKFSISPEEYIFAALNLYLDIIQIFIHILSIIGASKK